MLPPGGEKARSLPAPGRWAVASAPSQGTPRSAWGPLRATSAAPGAAVVGDGALGDSLPGDQAEAGAPDELRHGFRILAPFGEDRLLVWHADLAHPHHVHQHPAVIAFLAEADPPRVEPQLDGRR